jgi:hypothetical protein
MPKECLTAADDIAACAERVKNAKAAVVSAAEVVQGLAKQHAAAREVWCAARKELAAANEALVGTAGGYDDSWIHTE